MRSKGVPSLVVRTTVWEPAHERKAFWDMLGVWVRCWRKYMPTAKLVAATNCIYEVFKYGFDFVAPQNEDAYMVKLTHQSRIKDRMANYQKWEPLRTYPLSHEVYCDHDVILIRRPTAIEEWVKKNDGTLLAWRRPTYTGRKVHYGAFDEEVLLKGIIPGFLGMPPAYELDTRPLRGLSFRERMWRRTEGGWVALNVYMAQEIGGGVTWLDKRAIALCPGGRKRSDPIDASDLASACLVHARHVDRAKAVLRMLEV